MSNTDILRKTEKDLLPPGYILDYVFHFTIGDEHGTAEVDGYHPSSRDAIEICQSETEDSSPKPGQKRKLASDVLKLIFLKDLGLITRGRVYMTSQALYTWSQQQGSWLNVARKKYGIDVEFRTPPKHIRKQIKNALRTARSEMKRRG
jgi:hypothetical protein